MSGKKGTNFPFDQGLWTAAFAHVTSRFRWSKNLAFASSP
jgi:hypothetical protein